MDVERLVMGIAHPPVPVGRESALPELERFLAAGSGAPRALVLSGEPGIGKTTLWEVGVEFARALGFTALMSRSPRSSLVTTEKTSTSCARSSFRRARCASTSTGRRRPRRSAPRQPALGCGLSDHGGGIERRGAPTGRTRAANSPWGDPAMRTNELWISVADPQRGSPTRPTSDRRHGPRRDQRPRMARRPVARGLR
jgi:hypothetical protein